MIKWRKIFRPVITKLESETREYSISGEPEQLDELEKAFNLITYCCSVGASRSICLHIDGDGAANLKVKKGEGKLQEIDDGNELATESDTIDFGFGD